MSIAHVSHLTQSFPLALVWAIHHLLQALTAKVCELLSISALHRT